MDILALIERLLTLGWPAIVLVMIFVLWNEYVRKTDKYIASLEERISHYESISDIPPHTHSQRGEQGF